MAPTTLSTRNRGPWNTSPPTNRSRGGARSGVPDARAARSQARSGTVAGPVLDLTVAGLLDEDAGRALLGAVDDATTDGWWRVEVDLRSVSGHTGQGVAAVTKLCRTGSLLPGGIGFSVSAGASRAALLASLADA